MFATQRQEHPQMIVTTWNVRGLQQPPRQAAVTDFIKNNKVDVMGLLETKMKTNNFKFFMHNNFPENLLITLMLLQEAGCYLFGILGM